MDGIQTATYQRESHDGVDRLVRRRAVANRGDRRPKGPCAIRGEKGPARANW